MAANPNGRRNCGARGASATRKERTKSAPAEMMATQLRREGARTHTRISRGQFSVPLALYRVGTFRYVLLDPVKRPGPLWGHA